MAGDAIGDRMKCYEHAARSVLPRRLPVIVRLDGKAFHTWTRGLERPFSMPFMLAMNAVATRLCEEMQGAAIAFVQSDEISVLLHNYRRLASAAWFDNEVQKIVSVSAAIAAATMTEASRTLFGSMKSAYFDSRAFILPEAEFCNYFIWRQQDATRNSIQMLAQSLYSQAQIHRKNTSDLQDMIHKKGLNWNDLATERKRGRCIIRETTDGPSVGQRSRWVPCDVPIFSHERAFIERHLAVEDEPPPPVPRFVSAV